ncbi:MAG: tRNA (adenosine(37)-N6)-threonylcarbamoyltransferase complex dimerization subunit type 1 TsaB [Bacteroidetes bacterium]|nr:tRNA (adenosine(37)-N6)-threonylcarbamoyltransferase complex dimerization subunit type 1 TsaB [Bacteroidota bacterium]
MILILETSGPLVSVAICNQKGELLCSEQSLTPNSHAELLAEMANNCILAHGGYGKLSAIAVSQGPGSYTGLRIGVSLAKGLCYALSVPLVPVNAYKAMAAHAASHCSASTYIAFTDARRNEIYVSVFESGADRDEQVFPLIPDSQVWSELKSPRVFAGNCTEKVRELIDLRSDDVFLEMQPSAEYACKQAAQLFAGGRFADVAYFEPYYLKDFIPGIPKKFAL